MINGELPSRVYRTPDVSAHAVHPSLGGWMRRVQHQGFWADEGDRYGPKALHFPVKFHRPFRYGFGRPVHFDRHSLRNQPPSMRAHLEVLVKKIQAMRNGWSDMSPWQRATRFRWAMTAWSHVDGRKSLEDLADRCFALPRTSGKVNDAMEMAYFLDLHDLSAITTEVESYDRLKPHVKVKITRIEQEVKLRCLKAWFYMGIAKMVLGSLPPRRAEDFPATPFGTRPRLTNSAAHAADQRRPVDWSPQVMQSFTSHKKMALMTLPYKVEDWHVPGTSTVYMQRATLLATGYTLIADYYLANWCTPVNLQSAVSKEHSKTISQLRAYEVDGCVFDISTLLQHGHTAMVSVLQRYAGRTCTDKEVGRIMMTRYPFRAVARVAEQDEEAVAWDPRRLRHDIEASELQKLVDALPKPDREKKRKFEPMMEEEPAAGDGLKLKMAAPVERPIKRQATGERVKGKRRWLDWETEGLIERLQEQFAASGVFERWKAREQALFGEEVSGRRSRIWRDIGREGQGREGGSVGVVVMMPFFSPFRSDLCCCSVLSICDGHQPGCAFLQ